MSQKKNSIINSPGGLFRKFPVPHPCDNSFGAALSDKELNDLCCSTDVLYSET